MNFSELKQHCINMHVPIQQVAVEAGITYDGLKKGLSNDSLALRYVLPLCQALCITPNRFFGIPDKPQKQQVQNGGRNNSQYMDSDAVSALEAQLVAKDKQIEKLLELLAQK